MPPERSFAARQPLLAYLREFGHDKPRVALAIVLALIKHAPVVVLPLYIRYIFDVAVPTRDVTLLGLCVLGMVALIIVNISLHPLFIRLYSQVRREVAVRLRARLCERLHQLVFSYHDSADSGRLHSKVMQDVEKLDSFGRILVDPMLVQIASSFAAFAILASVQPAYLLLFGVFAPIVYLQRALLSRGVSRRFDELRVEQEKLNAEVGSMIQMIGLSRAHATEPEDLRRVGERLGEVRRLGTGADWQQHLLQSQIWCTYQLINIAVVALGSGLVIAGSGSIGEVVMAMSLVMMTLGGLNTILGELEMIYSAASAMRSIDEVLAFPSLEDNAGKPSLGQLDGRVEFRDVWFAYPSTKAPVLRSISLRIEPNQTIALVGTSGAGKTTFVKLLLGFYDPIQGEVLIDGQRLDAIDKRSLRRRVGVVTQETFLFNGTIFENLAHGRRDTPREAVEEAARRANAHDFIAQLERGYDTLIGDRGLRLSGGQKQRLSIARALLRDPRLLILDEATSSLDSQSEQAVQEALGELMRERTTFVIAHRLSTIRHADRILVFDDGRIVEDGGHDLLLRSGGLYARLVHLQEVV